MDWTGGTRRRFAPKKNNSTLQKQKSYFAKARAALNAPKHIAAFQSALQPSRSGTSDRSNIHHSSQDSGTARRRERYVESRISTPVQSGKQRYHNRPNTTPPLKHTPMKRKHRSPSAISANSSDHHSPGHFARSRQANNQQEPSRPMVTPTDGMDEEERLLLANRRRLLAQTDWLGLAPARPVHMKFPSSHEKDRIGKRRKIEASKSKKSEEAGRRMLTPLFQERLPLHEPTMSGALPADDFQVRIGTDALATQTQQSRRSHTPVNTSMRKPSTEFDSLSEESMLLGVDEDTFEEFQASYGVSAVRANWSQQAQQLCDIPNMTRSNYGPKVGDQAEVQTATITAELDGGSGPESYRQSIGKFDSNNDHFRDTDAASAQGALDLDTAEEREDDEFSPGRPRKTTLKDNPPEVSGPEQDDDDDEVWKQLMNIVQRASSNPSITAVKSSSLHLTTSETDNRPLLSRQQESDNVLEPLLSTPNGVGTLEVTTISDRERITSQSMVSEPSRKLASPSASLKQITNLAAQPAARNTETRYDDDENALWREFVCGTQDESDISSQILLNDKRDEHEFHDMSTLVPASSSYVVSDLGTSNKTTDGGDTLRVGESLPSGSSDKYRTTAQQQAQNANEFHHMKAQSFIVSHDIDGDSIEDKGAAPVEKHKQKNIHAMSTLNPKRFLPRRKPQKSPVQRSPSFLPPRREQSKASKLDHSIYDLVDSEGNSLA